MHLLFSKKEFGEVKRRIRGRAFEAGKASAELGLLEELERAEKKHKAELAAIIGYVAMYPEEVKVRAQTTDNTGSVPRHLNIQGVELVVPVEIIGSWTVSTPTKDEHYRLTYRAAPRRQ